MVVNSSLQNKKRCGCIYVCVQGINVYQLSKKGTSSAHYWLWLFSKLKWRPSLLQIFEEAPEAQSNVGGLLEPVHDLSWAGEFC